MRSATNPSSDVIRVGLIGAGGRGTGALQQSLSVPGSNIKLTAIGDVVNTASRLESMTKEFAVELVVSQELLERSGVTLAGAPHHYVEIRGRRERLDVRPVKRASELTPLSS